MQTILLLALLSLTPPGQTSRFPAPAKHAAPGSGEQVAVLAGGCFWGVEAIFEEIAGVKDVVSGFVVTTVVPFNGFYAADPSHQNFVARNPKYPYVVHNDLPKLEHLAKDYPDLLKRR